MGKWKVVGGLVGRWSVVLIKPVANRDVKEVVEKRLKDAAKRKGGEKTRIFKAGLMQQNVSLQSNRGIVNNLERNVKLVFLKSRIFFYF